MSLNTITSKLQQLAVFFRAASLAAVCVAFMARIGLAFVAIAAIFVCTQYTRSNSVRVRRSRR